MAPDADDGATHVETDLTPVERRLAHLRAIHTERGSYYDEPTMHEMTIGALRNHALADLQKTEYTARTAEGATRAPDLVAARRTMALAEAGVLLTVIGEDLTPSCRVHLVRFRELFAFLLETPR